jgi:hypothetical protein
MSDDVASAITSLSEFVSQLVSIISPLPKPLPMSLAGFHNTKRARETVCQWLGWRDDQNLRPSRLATHFTSDKASCLSIELSAAFRAQAVNLLAPPIDWTDRGELKAKQRWLVGLIEAAADATLELRTRPNSHEPPTLGHLAWRRVERINHCAEIARKLDAMHRVAIVGMSGTGKTFLAREFYEQNVAEPKIWYDAPEPDEHELSEGAFLELARSVFEWLIELVGPHGGDVREAKRKLQSLAGSLVSSIAVSEKLSKTASENVKSDFVSAVIASPDRAIALAKVVLPFVRRTQSAKRIAEAISIIVTLLPRRTSAGGRCTPLSWTMHDHSSRSNP